MATTLIRNPMVARTIPQPSNPLVLSPSKTKARKVLPSKRSRSPDLQVDSKPKRARVLLNDEERAAKEQMRATRELQRAVFRTKYMKAFPSWVFYFDLDHLDPESMAGLELFESRISHLGGRVEDFFSNEITHLITNQAAPTNEADKENNARDTRLLKQVSHPRSPINIRGRGDDVAPAFDLVKKALGFGMKIWNTSKLSSVLERLLVPNVAPASQSAHMPATSTSLATASRQRSLTRLLESERLHGATTERDPTQKRHDYRYFSRASYFVLVEDMRGELATIVAFEYPAKGPPTWPVLYCHPHARGPFLEFDEKEKRRWERSLMAEKAYGQNNAQVLHEIKRRARVPNTSKCGDLRRSVSMVNLHRHASHEGLVDLDADGAPDSTNASGYLASGAPACYMAASGNSVGITSTTGTTSTAGLAIRGFQHLPSSLQGKIENQVLTSRKASSVAQRNQKVGAMGPPVGVPDRVNVLRKSRSTNTLRLPKREEGSKPGYCESCRTRFDDFKEHCRSRKHTKFATDNANFAQLDIVLARVQRRTLNHAQRTWARQANCKSCCAEVRDDQGRQAESSCSLQDLTPRGKCLCDE